MHTYDGMEHYLFNNPANHQCIVDDIVRWMNDRLELQWMNRANASDDEDAQARAKVLEGVVDRALGRKEGGKEADQEKKEEDRTEA